MMPPPQQWSFTAPNNPFTAMISCAIGSVIMLILIVWLLIIQQTGQELWLFIGILFTLLFHAYKNHALWQTYRVWNQQAEFLRLDNDSFHYHIFPHGSGSLKYEEIESAHFDTRSMEHSDLEIKLKNNKNIKLSLKRMQREKGDGLIKDWMIAEEIMRRIRIKRAMNQFDL